MNRRRKSIVRALPHVHMVVGVDWFFSAKPIATRNLDCSVSNHFVDVHVTGCTRASLKNINREFSVKISIDNILTSVQHGLDLICVQWVLASARKLVQIAIGDTASMFDSPHRMDHRRRQLPTTNGKVLDGSLSLSSVISLSRHVHVAHAVVLGASGVCLSLSLAVLRLGHGCGVRHLRANHVKTVNVNT